MRPPGMSNTTRSFSSSIVQRFFTSDAEYGAPLSTLTKVAGSSVRRSTTSDGTATFSP